MTMMRSVTRGLSGLFTAGHEETYPDPFPPVPRARQAVSSSRSQAAPSNLKTALKFLPLWLLLACLGPALRADAPDMAVNSRGHLLIVKGDANAVLSLGTDGRVSPLRDISGEPMDFSEGLTSIAVDMSADDIFVSDFHEVYQVRAGGIPVRIAGNRQLVQNVLDSTQEQRATEFPLQDVVALEFDSRADTLYIAEYRGRVLALRDGRIRLYAGGVAPPEGPHGSDTEGVSLRAPISDMALGPDGSLYVAGRDRIWRVSPGGFPVSPVGQGNLRSAPSATGPTLPLWLPSIAGLAVQGERLFVSSAGGEIVTIEPDGKTELFASTEIGGGSIEFAPSGRLHFLSGDLSEFEVTEFDADGVPYRVLPARKGEDGLPQRRIIGGNRVSRDRLLAVVAVSMSTGNCTGSLIAPEWALTAAHCVVDHEGNSKGPFNVSVCNDLDDDCLHRDVPVSEVHVHPEYEHRGFIGYDDLPAGLSLVVPRELLDQALGPEGRRPRSWPFDFALLRLERRIEDVTPVQVADFSVEQSLARNGVVALQVGWGNTAYSLHDTQYPDHKRSIGTPIRESEQCRDFLTHSTEVYYLAEAVGASAVLRAINDLDRPLWNYRICAGRPRSPVRLASWGDSGSPLLVQQGDEWIAVGVLSSSLPRLTLTEVDFLNVYTRTASMFDWMNDVTGIPSSRIPSGGVEDGLRPNLERFRDCDECPEMVAVPTGSFVMGASSSEQGYQAREGPPQSVTMPRRVAVGVHEVTFREWSRCVDDGACSRRPHDSLRDSDRPVGNVHFWSAIRYTLWLSRKTGRSYRLPTGAEWEYVARAGTTTPFYTGADISTADANFGSGSRDRGGSRPAGSFPPNPWGLHDVAGNVWEWVQDCARDSLEGSDRYGRAWQMSGCSRRVLRGGAWFAAKSQVRSAHRSVLRPSQSAPWIGFRVARTLWDGASGQPPADDHASQPSSAATPITPGTPVPGRIERGDDEDWFRLEVREPTSVTVYTTGTMDTVGSLRVGSGREVAYDDDSGVGANFRIESTLGRGTYFVLVRSFGDRTGTYTLHVERSDADPAIPEEFENSLGMEFRLIPAGEFRMGSESAEADADESPVTHVRISRAYHMGKHEVTQGQWEALMGTNPSGFSHCGPNCPVEGVSWDDIQEFVRRLNDREGGAPYGLPTEAEWEYAARAGTLGERYDSDLDRIAWHAGNSGSRTHPVGQKTANAFGLHDMLGNVWEWVQDWHGEYPGGSVTDPAGPGSGTRRVGRGGGWAHGSRRVANRLSLPPGRRYSDVGFRLVREIDASGPAPPADDHGNTRDSATRLTLGTRIQARIDSGSDEDWFSFEVGQPSRVTLYTIGSLDTVGALFSAANRVAVDDDSGVGPNFRIEQNLDVGVYFLQIRSVGAGTGSYTLRTESAVADDHGNSRSTATRLTLGQPVAGRIGPGRDEDWFRFELDGRSRVTLFTTGNLNTSGSLWVGQNRVSSARDRDSGPGANFRIERTLDAGVYFLRVIAEGGQTGTYTLHTESSRNQVLTIDLQYPFEYQETRFGTVEQVRIASDEDDPSRLAVRVAVRMEDFLDTLDTYLRGLGDLRASKCSQKLFWLGDSRINRTGRRLQLRSRIRYEQWTCIFGKRQIRWFVYRANVDIDFYVNSAPIDELQLTYRPVNLQYLPRWLEWLLDLRRPVSMPLPIPWRTLGSSCSLSQVARTLDARLEQVRFTREGNDMLLELDLSMDNNLAVASGCLPRP